MPQEKQLIGISLESVVQKRTLDQALNAKEFAVLTGISYSAARNWFRQPGIPVVGGVVFWQAVVRWRKDQTGQSPSQPAQSNHEVPNVAPVKLQFPERAAQIHPGASQCEAIVRQWAQSLEAV